MPPEFRQPLPDMEIEEFPAGYEWGHAEIAQPALLSLNRHLVGIVLDRGGGLPPEYVGTGFIVMVDDGEALCITAAHVLDAARSPQPGVPADFQIPAFEQITNACRRGKLLAHVAIDGRDEFVNINPLTYMAAPRGPDIALLFLQSKLFVRRSLALAINSDLVPAGTPILAVGMPDTEITLNRIHTEYGLERRIMLYHRNMQARMGFVKALRADVGVVPGGVYHVSMSIPHGMSGGPILLYPKREPSAMQVIGFASYDSTPETVIDNPEVPGEFGIAMPILTALVTGITKDGQQITTLDLVRQGHVIDLGQRWPHLDVVFEGQDVFFRDRPTPWPRPPAPRLRPV